MVLQETFGEFNSTEKLRSLIKLICQLPGTYEVLIQTGEGEEGILHCANDTIRNAACRNLSGMEALAVVLSWPRGKYWLEELPVLPARSINLPLERIFTEVEQINPATRVTPVQTEDKKEEKSAAPQTEAKGAPAAVKQQEYLKIEERLKEPLIEKKPAPVAESVKPGDAPQVKAEPKPVQPPAPEQKPEVKPAPAPAAKPAASTVVPKILSDPEGLPKRIAAVKGVNSVIVASMDGSLITSVNIEPSSDLVQMIAIFGEALGQVGDLFGKAKFKHGSIDMGAERILLHVFRSSYIASFITPTASAATVGGDIENLISKEL